MNQSNVSIHLSLGCLIDMLNTSDSTYRHAQCLSTYMYYDTVSSQILVGDFMDRKYLGGQNVKHAEAGQWREKKQAHGRCWEGKRKEMRL